jgi:phospholipase D1/2
MDAAPGMGSKDGQAAVADADVDVVYLHGVLEATVFEADHLHNAIHARIMKVNDRSAAPMLT